MSVIIDEGIELVGAIIEGEDGATHVESKTFCYRNLEEFSKSKSFGVTVGFIWDSENMAFGSGIPITVDTDYHHKVEAGTTKATVAGTDADGKDPLHITNPEASDDLANLNRDSDNVQERYVVKDKHVRVFLPIINPTKFKESLDLIGDVYFSPGERPDFGGFKQALYESAEAEEESMPSSDSDDAGIAQESITVAFLGEEGDDLGQIMHTSIEIPSGEGDIGSNPTRIEEISQLGASPGEDFEVSVVYSNTSDEVEIIYSDDAVKRRVVMGGEAFKGSMLGTDIEGDSLVWNLVYDIEGYPVSGDLGAYGFDGSDNLMNRALAQFSGRVGSVESSPLSTSDWLEIVFSKETARAAKEGAKEYGLGIAEGVVDTVKAPFELLELYATVTDLAVNDSETFNQMTGQILTALGKKETYKDAWNSVVEDITSSRGMGRLYGDTMASMVGLGMLKRLKILSKNIDFLNENTLRRYWKREVEFDGKKVYQRDDLFDPNWVDDKGRTNLERMKKGIAPEGVDGKSVNLHHTTQADNGPIAEILDTMHKEYEKLIHVNIPKADFPSGINRPKFNKWRDSYWRARARDFEKGINQ